MAAGRTPAWSATSTNLPTCVLNVLGTEWITGSPSTTPGWVDGAFTDCGNIWTGISLRGSVSFSPFLWKDTKQGSTPPDWGRGAAELTKRLTTSSRSVWVQIAPKADSAVMTLNTTPWVQPGGSAVTSGPGSDPTWQRLKKSFEFQTEAADLFCQGLIVYLTSV